MPASTGTVGVHPQAATQRPGMRTSAPEPRPRAYPTWIRADERPLAAWIHPTAGPSRGTVVLCSPIGREWSSTYRGLRRLAEDLALAGFVTVRFSWTAQGDSAPCPDDTSILDCVTEDLRSVLSAARAAGTGRVNVVGLRAGALLAAHALRESDVPIHSFLAWDAVTSGRRFLREQRALLISSVSDRTPAGDGDFYGPGWQLRADDATEISRLRFALPAAPRATHRGVLELDAPVPRDLGADVHTIRMDPQHEFTQVPGLLSKMPMTNFARITDWLSSVNPTLDEEVVWDPATTARIKCRDGWATETMVTIGPDDLPGILTESSDSGPGSRSMLLVPSSTEEKSGPGGLWARVARAGAARSAVVTLRADKFGVGDGGPSAPDGTTSYEPRFAADVGRFADWLTERSGHKPIGVGICSGAYLVTLNATHLGHAVAVGQLVFDDDIGRIPREEATAIDAPATPGSPPPGFKPWIRAALKQHLPHWAWKCLGDLHLARTPDQLIRATAPVPITFISEPRDQRLLELQRVPEATRHAEGATQRVVFEVSADLDHAVLGPMGQRAIHARVLQIAAGDGTSHPHRPPTDLDGIASESVL